MIDKSGSFFTNQIKSRPSNHLGSNSQSSDECFSSRSKQKLQVRAQGNFESNYNKDMSVMLDQRYNDSMEGHIFNLDPEKCHGKGHKKMFAEIKAEQQQNFESVVRNASAAMVAPVVKKIFSSTSMGAISEKSQECSDASPSSF